jgi:ceroid-lipofuscinosis protein 8
MPMTVFLMLYVQLTLVSLVMTPYWTYKKTAQMINPVDWNFEKPHTRDSNGFARQLSSTNLAAEGLGKKGV